MITLALAGGSWIFLAFVLVMIVAVAYGYYSVRGSGIGQHGWADRDRVFGTRAGKDATVDVATWGRGSASSKARGRRKTELEDRTAAAIAERVDGDPTWRARIGESVQLAPLVDPERDHVRGSAAAVVTLVEYGEYECKYCREAALVLEQIKREHGEAIQVVFRHFPQATIHPHAEDAAVAAEAAGRQGRFWEMHDLLSKLRKAPEARVLHDLARKAGLDVERFTVDVEDPELRARVAFDLQSGLQSGVNGTPTFFINNVRYDGDFEAQELLAAIETARAVAAEHRD